MEAATPAPQCQRPATSDGDQRRRPATSMPCCWYTHTTLVSASDAGLPDCLRWPPAGDGPTGDEGECLSAAVLVFHLGATQSRSRARPNTCHAILPPPYIHGHRHDGTHAKPWGRRLPTRSTLRCQASSFLFTTLLGGGGTRARGHACQCQCRCSSPKDPRHARRRPHVRAFVNLAIWMYPWGVVGISSVWAAAWVCYGGHGRRRGEKGGADRGNPEPTCA